MLDNYKDILLLERHSGTLLEDGLILLQTVFLLLSLKMRHNVGNDVLMDD